MVFKVFLEIIFMSVQACLSANLKVLLYFHKNQSRLLIYSSKSSAPGHSLTLFVSIIHSMYPTDRLPYSIRVLLESAVRNCDEFQVRPADVNNILEWEQNQAKSVEIPFHPARVILQDFT